MSLGKNILKEIKKEKIKPRAKWLFVLKNIFTWILGIFSLIISSLSVSVIINIINNNDYPLFRMMHPSPVRIIIQTLPYFWIMGIIIFVIIFRYTLKQTKDGYKIEVYKIIIISVLLSIILGTFFYVLGIGTNIDKFFSRKSGLYNQMMKPCHTMWTQENQGMIAGKILTIIDQNNFDLEDLNQKQWRVIRIEDKKAELKFKKRLAPRINLEPNLEIRALGKKIDKNTFQAFGIKPAPPCPCSN